MNIYVDTAAFLAVLNANDRFHAQALQVWNEILDTNVTLSSSNYIILETTALLQHRFGMEAVRLLENEVMPTIQVIWVDEAIHKQGMSALLIANRRELSLVDCTSFEIMRQMGMDAAFTFDFHFREQGFKVLPEEMAA